MTIRDPDPFMPSYRTTEEQQEIEQLREENADLQRRLEETRSSLSTTQRALEEWKVLHSNAKIRTQLILARQRCMDLEEKLVRLMSAKEG